MTHRTIIGTSLAASALLFASLAHSATPRPPRAARAASSASSGFTLVVADGTDIDRVDDGAIYRITDFGVQTIANGPPLKSPTGILYFGTNAGVQQFLVSDMNIWSSTARDGAVFLVSDSPTIPIETVFQGTPLISPYGMVRQGNLLYLADFGNPSPLFLDGAIYELNLDPDANGVPGPFPLSAANLRTVYSGAPLGGPNEIIWLAPGLSILLGDDSGRLYTMNVAPLTNPNPQVFGPNIFQDPAGVALWRNGYVAIDFQLQEVWQLDLFGANPVLLLAGNRLLDQFLGSVTDGLDTLWFANAGTFQRGRPDGQIIKLAPGFAGVIHDGAPLINPFDVELAPAVPGP